MTSERLCGITLPAIMKHSLLILCLAVVFSSKVVAGYSEQEIVAATLIMEAGGEHHKYGMIAVYEVIQNRASVANKTFSQICLARKQFSCWNGITDISKTIAKAKKHTKWNDAMRVVINNLNIKYTRGATHYHSNKINPPSWSKKMICIGSIGNHIFYR